MGSAPHGPDTEAEYRDSPMPPVVEQRKTIRFRLEDIALEDLKAPVLRNLKIEGCTDYVAQPLVFSTGQVDALSLVSDRPGGFANGDLRRLYQLHFAFALVDLAIGHQPDVSGDTGVVEHVERKRDDRIQPIVFDQVTPHVALALTSITREKR